MNRHLVMTADLIGWASAGLLEPVPDPFNSCLLPACSLPGGRTEFSPLRLKVSTRKQEEEEMMEEASASNLQEGTSPLPLGLDWCPPPNKMEGRHTKRLSDLCTGWRYFVLIPSWVVQPESASSRGSHPNPIVFFRVEVGIQSPRGINTNHKIFRRFSDFLKLFSDMKRQFPRINIPWAPPKHSLLRVNSSQLLLEERRRDLEEWMTNLLSNIEISRSAPIASFLELEAAVRLSCQDLQQHSVQNKLLSEAVGIPSSPLNRNSPNAISTDYLSSPSNSHLRGSNFDSSDVYKAPIIEAPSEKLKASDTELEKITMTEQLYTRGMLHMPKSIQDQLEDSCKGMLHQETEILVSNCDGLIESSEKACLCDNELDSTIEMDHNTINDHVQELSVGSHTSDINCNKGAQEAYTRMNVPLMNNSQVSDPHDYKHILSRALLIVQQRLLTTKEDIDGLVLLLNQEMTAKDHLMAKVNDLEEELRVIKWKNKETLQQAILAEKGRVTKIQWDTDEFLGKVLQIESRLKLEEIERIHVESEKIASSAERELLLRELNSKRKHLEKLEKLFEEAEMKSKTDLKVLLKEVKFLRKSQESIREVLNHCIRENEEIETVLQKEKQRRDYAILATRKLLSEIGGLRHRLEECSVNFLADKEEKFTVNPSTLPDALGLLITSDNRINLLMSEAERLAQYDGLPKNCFSEKNTTSIVDDLEANYCDMRNLLAETVADNARLRRQMNTILRCALKEVNYFQNKPKEEGSPGMKFLRWFGQK